MGVWVWVILCGLVNLSLGFGLAMYFGYGPPTVGDAWRALSDVGWGGSAADASRPQPANARPVPLVAPENLGEMLDSGSEDHLSIEPFIEPYDNDLAELLAPPSPEAWDLNEKFVETSVLKLNIAMMKSGARATEIDTRLRQARGHLDAGTLQRCLDELVTDCEIYLAEQREAAQQLHERIGELGELAALAEEIEMANMEQAAQIETTLSNLRHMDLQSDLEGAATRLLGEIHRLRVARHKLRDSQEIAFLTIARYENRLEKIERQLFNDALTRMRNRVGLEVTLHEWWRQGRPRNRSLCAALWDLDAFGRINEQHGSRVGDRILMHTAELIQGLVGEADLPARYAGQRFFVMLVDTGPRGATKTVELIRQSLARVTFRHQGREIRVTACGALAEVESGEAPEQLFARLEEALRAAKQAGPNRTFFHNGRRPEPIEAPNLGAEYREVDL